MFAVSVAECVRAYVSWPRALAALACTSRALRALLGDDVRALAELIRLCAMYDRLVALTIDGGDSYAADNGAPRCVLRRAMFATLALRLRCVTSHVDFAARFARYARTVLCVEGCASASVAVCEMAAVVLVANDRPVVVYATKIRQAKELIWATVEALSGARARASGRLYVCSRGVFAPTHFWTQRHERAALTIFIERLHRFDAESVSEYDIATRDDVSVDEALALASTKCELYARQREWRCAFNYFDD